MRTREDVWKYGPDWNPTLLWYARAVAELQQLPPNDRRSWWYLAAIHGIDLEFWRLLGVDLNGRPMPAPAEQQQMWRQCQHSTWYFLPWHRGYLLAFERIIAATIERIGGPPGWALPYWNYSDRNNPDALILHPAFRAPQLPGGGRNPLFVQQRYGIRPDGSVALRQASDVSLDALLETDFGRVNVGGSPGFGGSVTPFNHSGGRQGGVLEGVPHGVLHVDIGGFVRTTLDGRPVDLPGWMSNPISAGLDPIFWLHHANIDRLWEVWRRRDPLNRDPAEADWLRGPQPPQQRAFLMPSVDGSGLQRFAPEQMQRTDAPGLEYVYQDVSDPLGGASRRRQRLQLFGIESDAIDAKEATMADKRAELIGASEQPMKISGAADSRIRVDAAGGDKLRARMRDFRVSAENALFEAAGAEPDRVFLNLEQIRGTNDAVVLDVYLNLPAGADPDAHPEAFAGSVSMFGLTNACTADEAHAGDGLDAVLEITGLVDRLDLDGDGLPDTLDVRIVPRRELLEQDAISIGRISVYREGQ
jgi:tyrosinase